MSSALRMLNSRWIFIEIGPLLIVDMKDEDCISFLQGVLPRLQLRWPGFRKVRRQVCKRVQRRIELLGFSDVQAYRAWLGTHPDEWRVLDAFCQITISRFYRDKRLFQCLETDVIRHIVQRIQRDGEQTPAAGPGRSPTPWRCCGRFASRRCFRVSSLTFWQAMQTLT